MIWQWHCYQPFFRNISIVVDRSLKICFFVADCYTSISTPAKTFKDKHLYFSYTLSFGYTVLVGCRLHALLISSGMFWNGTFSFRHQREWMKSTFLLFGKESFLKSSNKKQIKLIEQTFPRVHINWISLNSYSD